MLRGVKAVVLALSGGKDSVCLFHLLREVLASRGVRFLCAHVNHGLRARRSERDERFCRELCRANGVEFFAFSCDVKRFAKEHSRSLEDAARQLRYQVLLDFAREQNAVLATAHTASDQAETLLMRLVRGVGLSGASGIEPVRADGVIRPLLAFTSEDVQTVLKTRGFSHVTDHTNRDTRFARNFYRHRVIPLLKRQNPLLDQSLSRFARNAGEEHRAFLTLAQEKLASLSLYPIGSRMKKEPIVSLALERERRAVLYYLFSEMLSVSGGGTLSDSAFSRLLSYLQTGGIVGAKLEVGGGFSFLVEQDSLAVVSETNAALQAQALSVGETKFGSAVVSLEGGVFAKEVLKIHKMHTSAYLSCDKIVGDLCVRTRRAGDTYTVCGKERLVKDLFSSRLIPFGMRETYPLVCDARGIVWIPGELAADRVRAETGARAVCISLCGGELYDELLKRRHHE